MCVCEREGEWLCVKYPWGDCICNPFVRGKMGGIYAAGSLQKRTCVFLVPCLSVWKHKLVFTRQCTSGCKRASTGEYASAFTAVCEAASTREVAVGVCPAELFHWEDTG